MRQTIYVISLSTALSRRRAFESRIPECQVVRLFDAHREISPELTYDEASAIVTKGRPLSKGELGCYSSHFTVWQEFLSTPEKSAFVLEDDVVADWGALSAIAQFANSNSNIIYLRLYAKRPCNMHILAENIAGGRSIVDYRGFAYGTQGYYLTRIAASRLVEHCRIIRRCIDDEMDRSWAHGIPNLAIFPFPVIEASLGSTIGEARYVSPAVPRNLQRRRLLARASDRWLRLKQVLSGYGRVRELDL